MHFLTLENLSTDEIMTLIQKTIEIKETGKFPDLGGKYVANLFFENSTRTKVSFEMAERKTNMEIIPFEISTSSVLKGETLYDTVKTLQSVGVEAVVIRHPENEYYNELLQGIDIPIINGGDGTGNHPSQSLLDLVTIYEEYGRFAGLKIAIVGDIAHSRVANSNAKILERLGAEVVLVAPTEWQRDLGFAYQGLDEVIEELDVVMLLRVQHERHKATVHELESYCEAFSLTEARVDKMKPRAIIMHPAPINRNVEIVDELVECDRSRIFKQMTNGMFARTAILEYVFGGSTYETNNAY